MEKEVLDDFYFEDKAVTTNEDIKRRLRNGGFKQHFELKDQSILVKESDNIQVIIKFKNGKPEITPKFPQIGNMVQAIATVLILFGCFAIDFPFPLDWITAIVGGQIISFGVHYYKINGLKDRIEMLLI